MLEFTDNLSKELKNASKALGELQNENEKVNSDKDALLDYIDELKD
jgi:hypothetical protein